VIATPIVEDDGAEATVAVSVSVAFSPALLIVVDVVPVLPEAIVTLDVLEEMVKFPVMLRVKLARRNMLPLVAFTVTT
jgi:hypothetical protein